MPQDQSASLTLDGATLDAQSPEKDRSLFLLYRNPTKPNNEMKPFPVSRYDPEPMPWSAAQAKCKEVDANCNLVGIHHDAENAAVQTIPIDRKTEIWTGFVDEDVGLRNYSLS